jgi:hypothetical protein
MEEEETRKGGGGGTPGKGPKPDHIEFVLYI